jgi:hypothetical protein
MLIAWRNLADDAVLTSDSEAATLPASNVQQEHVVRVWRTVAGVKSAYLIFDMGSAVACSVLAALGLNFTASATVRVRASDADATVESSLLLDTGVLDAEVVDGYGAIYKSFTETAARYWRIDFADAGVESYLQVGRIFLGPSWTPTHRMLLGASYTSDDPSIIGRSRAGQQFADILPQRRVLQFELAFMDEEEMFTNAFAIARAAGRVSDVLVIPNPSSDYLSQRSIFGTLAASQPLVNDVLYLYRQKFIVEERL